MPHFCVGFASFAPLTAGFLCDKIKLVKEQREKSPCSSFIPSFFKNRKRLDEIFPYENNPRVNDGAVDAVANSIRDFGFLQPIVVDRDGIIIVGHTRYRAAAKLGLEEVPVVVAGDLSDKKAQAYRLADNKTGEISSWAFDKLMTELDALDQSGIDLTPLRFHWSPGEEGRA